MYKNNEFNGLINPILKNKEFQKTKKIAHHGITRYEHSLRVAYYSYIITKHLGLDYKETTEAALLHDFFIDEVKHENAVFRLRRHPKHAVKNAKKYFDISDKQEDIIKTHMFPITFTPPKYIESWIVDIVDDIAAIYEKTYSVKNDIKSAATFVLILIVNFIKMR